MQHADDGAARALDDDEAAEEAVGGERQDAVDEHRALHHARRLEALARHQAVSHRERRQVGHVRQRLARRPIRLPRHMHNHIHTFFLVKKRKSAHIISG